MNRRVRRKVTEKGKGKEKVDLQCYPEVRYEESCVAQTRDVDWTKLPDDTVIQLFMCLNYRDRASLASTCVAWRILGSSPCLWSSLDLRAHKCDGAVSSSLASRCAHVKKLRFRGVESADAIINLQARGLCEISGDYCRKITDSTLCVIAARHELLESLQLGPDFCEGISSDAIKQIAYCCPRLKKLRLSGLREIEVGAINALAAYCLDLTYIGFLDCLVVDANALGNVKSIQFLSVAGTSNINWNVTPQAWSTLPNLVGLDVSRTDIGPVSVSSLFSGSMSLEVLCALNCPILEEDINFAASNTKGKLLLALFTDIFKGLKSLFANNSSDEKDIFSAWRESKHKNKSSDELMVWLEWTLSHTLLRIAETNTQQGLDSFWLKQGASLFLSLMQSSQEDVQERAATGLATFVVIDDELATVDGGRAEAVMQDGGIRQLLNLAKSSREGLQAEAAKALANLSVNSSVAKLVAEEGGITLLAELARSMNRLVAEEAAGGLWNLSVVEEHKGSIAEAGGVKSLVDLIYRSPAGGDGVLERAAGALANLAANEKCSLEIARVGGIKALVMLTQNCKFDGVQEQAARALANMAAHGDSNCNNAAVGQEAGALEALVRLTKSTHEGVRQEAAGALWNLSLDDRNREAIAAAGGVDALIELARSCADASPGLQERAAGALWGLSVSEINSITIGQEGVPPLIALARSETEDVHETAAGALWNLAFNPGNALRIVEEGGVPALVHICASSASMMARFMAALALSYMFDGRMDEVTSIGTSSESIGKAAFLDGARRKALKRIDRFIFMFSDPQVYTAASISCAPTALNQVTEAARIQEAGHLRCSGAEIGRFVSMLRNPSSILKSCAAFALLQFTIPGGRHAMHHSVLLQDAGSARILRAAAAAANAPLEAKIFARIVLRNLEHHHKELSV